jgi:hypothetical protein
LKSTQQNARQAGRFSLPCRIRPKSGASASAQLPVWLLQYLPPAFSQQAGLSRQAWLLPAPVLWLLSWPAF